MFALIETSPLIGVDIRLFHILKSSIQSSQLTELFTQNQGIFEE